MSIRVFNWTPVDLMENTSVCSNFLRFVNQFFHLFILHMPCCTTCVKGHLCVCLFYFVDWTVHSCCLYVECVVARALGLTCDGDHESESGSMEMIRQARSVAAAVVRHAEFAHCGLLMVCTCGLNIKTAALVGQSDPQNVTASCCEQLRFGALGSSLMAKRFAMSWICSVNYDQLQSTLKGTN